jgi:hypothetical protein
MFKKVMMLAVAAAALAAFVIPATASAEWTHNHQSLVGNANIEVTGQAKFQGEVGFVECQTKAIAQLTGGTTTADVQAFEVDVQGTETVTDNCSVGGGLLSLQCTDVSSVTTAGIPWTAHATSTKTVAVTTGTIQNHLHGGFFCPKTIQLTPGTVHITASTENTWTTGELSGELQADPSIGGPQQVIITGHGTITPSGTYGVK